MPAEGAEYQEQPMARFIPLEVTGEWIDTRTRDVLSAEERQDSLSKLEQDNSEFIDDQ